MLPSSELHTHSQSDLTIDKLLKPNSIKVGVYVKDWRDAVTKAGELLVNSGAVKMNYTAAMIKTVEELGPYIVIAPGIAMPHARITDDVIETALCIVSLAEPVMFGHPQNDPVRLVLGLAATNHDTHITVMSQLADILDMPDVVKAIMDASTSDDVLNTIHHTIVDKTRDIK